MPKVIIMVELPGAPREFIGPFDTIEDAMAHAATFSAHIPWHTHPIYPTLEALRSAVAD